MRESRRKKTETVRPAKESEFRNPSKLYRHQLIGVFDTYEDPAYFALHEAPGISLTPSEKDRFSACSLLIFVIEG
ncbi:hypothetical protein ACROYT_G004899 [Oculina patagonica]